MSASGGRHCGPTFSHLIGVGGDATLSAAAEVAIRVGVPLVPVPRGFGNVFARTFGHDDRAEAIVELIESGAVCRVDVGCAGQEIFLCHRSYGFLEDVQSAVERNRAQPRSRLRRHLAYYAMACEILGKIPLSTIRVDVDGERVAENCALVTVANVETYRGFLTLTPAASPLDGLLDICIIPQTTKRRLFARLFALLLKLPGRWNGVQLRRGRDVSVTVDGRARDELRVAPGALPLVVPAARISVRRPPRALVAGGRPFTRAA
jgi:diacylglycerol kinase (ATP)